MSDLVTFAKACGIIIDSPPPIGYWRRYPTVDHPKKRNGAVKFMGDHAFVQNWATDTEVVLWKSDKPVDMNQVRRNVDEAIRRKRDNQEAAARKAGWILKQCQLGKHQYLKDKGFPDEQANVWVNDGKQFLVIPMRVGNRLVGCQLIDDAGGKKFLFGQRTGDAEFVFDNKGTHIYCEGFATALSIRAVLKSLKKQYTLHVCFSAGNLEKVAKAYGAGVVVADNDESKTGETVAQRIGFPYFMPPLVGQDFNDFHQEVGLLKASMALNKLLRPRQVG